MSSVTMVLAMTLLMLQPNKVAPRRNSATKMLSNNNRKKVAPAATMTKERVWMLMKL